MISAITIGDRIRRSLWRLASARTAALETVAELLAAAAELELGAAAMLPEEPAADDPDPEPRLMRLRSARSSAADWVRRSGSFSSDFRITSFNWGGSRGFRSAGGDGFFSRMAWKITAEVGPSKGRRPVDI